MAAEPRLDEGARDDLMATKRRLDEAERASTTEKLLHRRSSAPTPRQEARDAALRRLRPFSRGTRTNTFGKPRSPPQRALPHPQPVQHRAVQGAALPITMMNSYVDGRLHANTRKAVKRARCAMLFATYDYEKRPYYFHPDRRKVQWHPPPNQDAILVCSSLLPRGRSSRRRERGRPGPPVVSRRWFLGASPSATAAVRSRRRSNQRVRNHGTRGCGVGRALESPKPQPILLIQKPAT